MILTVFFKSYSYTYEVDKYYFKEKYLYIVQGEVVTRTYIHSDYLIFLSVFDREGNVIEFSSKPGQETIQDLADLL